MSKLLTLACVLLGVSVIGTGLWGYQNHQSTQQLTANNEHLQAELTVSQNRLLAMERLQQELQAEVDSLINAFTTANQQNEHLEKLLAIARRRNTKLDQQMAERATMIEELKASAKKDRGNLLAQLTVLIKAKSKLEVEVKEVKTSNKKLTKKAVALGLDPNKSLAENKVIVKQIRERALAERNSEPVAVVEETPPPAVVLPIQATSFRIEIGGKKDKITAKAKKAKDIQVSFDLLNIPADHREKSLMYLVIVNEKGESIKCTTPIKAVVPVGGQDKEILSLVKREVEIETGKRLTFTWELEDKIEPGYYRVEIHSEQGFMGEASFRLG